MNESDKELKQLETELHKYTVYLKNLVIDLKKRNYPLSKYYYKTSKLRWSRYHKWYFIDTVTDIKEKVDWDRFLYAVHNDLKQQDFYKKMDDKINSVSKNKDKFLFGRYVEKALFVFCYDENDEFFSIKNLVKYLIDAIKNEQPTVNTTSFLSGIMIDSDEIVINKHLKIRKAKKKDFEIDVKPEEYSDYREVVERCFCILEHTYKRESEYTQSFQILKKIELTLSLFKLSSPDCIGTNHKSADITHTFHGTYRLGFYHSPGLQYYAKIKENELDYLRKFFQIMNKRLTRSTVDHYMENNELEISLERYSRGLELVHLIKISVSYAVMAIEALLIRSEGDQRLRFALNSSKLLGLIGLDPKTVYENMLIAYDVRSKYVHGDKMSRKTETAIKSKFKHTDEFGFLIMDYARLIIVIYILLNKTKMELYNMLTDAQFEKGEKILKNKIKILHRYLKMTKYNPKFKIYPFHRHFVTE